MLRELTPQIIPPTRAHRAGQRSALRVAMRVGSIVARPCSGPMSLQSRSKRVHVRFIVEWLDFQCADPCLSPALVNTDAAGHHASEYEARLGAVKASALRADRAGAYARLRALTAPARSSWICSYLMAGRRSAAHPDRWLSLTRIVGRGILRTSRRCHPTPPSALHPVHADRVSHPRPQGTIQRSIEVSSVFVHRRCTYDWFRNEASS